MDTVFNDERFLHDIRRSFIIKKIKEYEINELNMKFVKDEI